MEDLLCPSYILLLLHIVSSGKNIFYFIFKLNLIFYFNYIFRLTANRLTIRAGSSYLGSGGVVKSVASFTTHPNYNTRTLDYDVAVMKLSSPLTYTNAIKKISLTTTRPASGSVATVTGWGANRRGGAATYQLQAVQVPVVAQTTCKNRYSAAGLSVTDRMLCAGYLYVGGKDSCQGDSGGPLTYGGLLVGIVSWGTGTCGSAYYPSVYGSVPNLYSWITQNVVLD